MTDMDTELQAVLDGQDGPAILIDEQYRIVAANNAYRAAYALGNSALDGRRCHEVSHHSEVPCHLNGEDCPHKQVFATEAPVEVLHEHYDATGRVEHVRIFGSMVRAIRGQRYLLEAVRRLPDVRIESLDRVTVVGHSPAYLHMLDQLHRAAESSAPVLLTGESGAGKEIASHFIHEYSSRAGKPLIAVDCAAIPVSMAEDELFGHERGAFTGCVGAHKGLVEQAHGGTLFLDEVGELPLGIQAKLLRVLDVGELRRLGGERTTRVDVRIVSATNRDLRKMVEAGEFRAELYYRLAGVEVAVPPLRQRCADIPALAEAILGQMSRGSGQHYQLTEAALGKLMAYSFAGNIRELKHILSRAVLRAKSGVVDHGQISLADNPYSMPRSPAEVGPAAAMEGPRPDRPISDDLRGLSLADMTREHLRRALAAHRGHRGKTAKALGLSERTLYRKIKRLGLEG